MSSYLAQERVSSGRRGQDCTTQGEQIFNRYCLSIFYFLILLAFHIHTRQMEILSF